MSDKEEQQNTSDLVHITVAKDKSPAELPDGNPLVLNLLEGWDNLKEEQHKYLQYLAQDPNKPRMTAMRLGYPWSRVNDWFKKDGDFAQVAEQIDGIYTEVLIAEDYKTGLESPKYRGRVLKAREAKGYTDEKKDNKHVHFHGMDAGSLLNELKDKDSD